MKQIVLAYAAWIAVISVISIIVTVKDKISAKMKARRTRESTLLLLVSAFLHGDWRRIYDYALAHDFRFLSYGDSSLLIP